MKTNYYIIQLEGASGTYHTVRKVFTTIEKADAYLKRNCAYIITGDMMDEVVRTSIVRVEMV